MELNHKNYLIFEKYTKFVSKYIIMIANLGQYCFEVINIILSLLLAIRYPSLIMFISIVVWLVLSHIQIRAIAGIVVTSFYFMYIISLYLRLRFNQIHQNLSHLIGQGNFWLKIQTNQIISLWWQLLKENWWNNCTNTTSAVDLYWLSMNGSVISYSSFIT